MGGISYISETSEIREIKDVALSLIKLKMYTRVPPLDHPSPPLPLFCQLCTLLSIWRSSVNIALL